ncbi:uncharacterized protein LOC125298650 [Alosa alosa]|uniref:uncharacterized protein LOC125298650 n=1 Tax=Alosa alosa TaxID=278164 RepID=UPI0020150771|nr:uncharacterized protein LOC125298650 [Alosa alosa]XP_048105447.1 uncharacterized protein LOC125298650 [Alosa alosa]
MDQVLYSVVQFPNGGTAIVLQSWLRDNTLLWPPKKIPLAKALQQRMEPDSTWITYSDVCQLITCQTYEEARRGEHKYNTTMCATAEIESEEEKEEEREKRKTKPNPLYMDSDSDEPSGEVKKPRVLCLPNVRVPESWSQLARNDMFAGASASNASAHEQFHHEMMAASTGGAGPYHQLQVPQKEGGAGPALGRTTSCRSHRRRAALGRTTSCRSHRRRAALGRTTSCRSHRERVPVYFIFRAPQGENGQLLKDLAIQKMTGMLAEVLVVVKELS